MNILTRLEEFVLLAILHLENNAYLVTIQEHLKKSAAQNLSFGTLHVLLKRLEQSGMILSVVGEATRKRGGRAVKYYVPTREGIEKLKEVQALNETMWADFSKLSG